VCITWNSDDGLLEVYLDGNLHYEDTNVTTGDDIPSSGKWIIGQDQDNYNEGFEEESAFQGSLTDVNVWDRALDGNEIFILSLEKCSGLGMQGNFKAYKDMVPHGAVAKFTPADCN
jgi:hypothetical protein